MKLRFLVSLLWMVLISASGFSCASTPDTPLLLASFTANSVDVSLFLERDSAGNTFLSGTFTPPDGYHLYSKDVSIRGVNGLGRPTLLELTGGNQIKAVGHLTESVKAQQPDFEPIGLLIYPPGAVTLSLPIALPSGRDWIDAEVKITYMTCNGNLCKPPVEGKMVSIRVPGADLIRNK